MPLFKTIPTREQYLVREKGTGRTHIIEGPNYVNAFRKSFERLNPSAASERQYIYIEELSGDVRHVPGPSLIFFNPIIHNYIVCKDGIALDASSALVVYKQISESDEVEQRVVYGPTLFLPTADEWLHSFSWHGPTQENKTDYKPNLNKFTVLKIIPDQMYFNVNDARTKDDALIRIKLMIFYELREVNVMLKQTADPIADIINAVSSDTITFLAKVTYEEFVDAANALNNLDSFPNLVSRAKRMGFLISKVIYRGFKADDKLQNIHDQAVSNRNNLRLTREKEVNTQKQEETQLLAEKQKLELEKKVEVEQMKNAFEIKKQELGLSIELAKKSLTENLRQEKEVHDSYMNNEWAKYEHKLRHYKLLKSMGVDLTEYLLRENPKPGKVIKYVSNNTDSIHIHHGTDPAKH
ncbi:hypothetical protein LOD99_4952 [Oopsacas minuta]|uniref:Band 7 domain-containing protein n=1 Tax=Oopsacas minuta TaxID=111878 RepID=A0AAV7JS51_9METZ|nr:hypothetical protein LOD99_4952 [Oopsacas minuta]